MSRLFLLALAIALTGGIYIFTSKYIFKETNNTMPNVPIADATKEPMDTETTVSPEENGAGTIVDLTLNPGSDWIEKEICGVRYKVHESFEEQPYSECTVNVNYTDYAGLIYPQTFSITVYNDYDGGSRRDFVINKKDYNVSTDMDKVRGFRYIGADEAIAGNNNILVMQWEAIDFGGSIAGFERYLIAIDANTLVVVGKGNGNNFPSLSDEIQQVLTSIN